MHMGDGWRGPLDKIDAFRYEIPRSYKPAMRTCGLIFNDEPMVAQLRQDQAPEQVANVATMPGIIGNAMAMPDIHWGYGFPIGGGSAFYFPRGGDAGRRRGHRGFIVTESDRPDPSVPATERAPSTNPASSQLSLFVEALWARARGWACLAVDQNCGHRFLGSQGGS